MVIGVTFGGWTKHRVSHRVRSVGADGMVPIAPFLTLIPNFGLYSMLVSCYHEPVPTSLYDQHIAGSIDILKLT